MKIFVKLGLLFTLLWGSPLFAFTLCTTADWDEDICSLEKAGTRCSVDRAARVMVQNMCTAAACPPTIGGGCKGFLGSGKWFPVSIDAVSLRCQCGCSAEETEFASEFGLITGTELLTFRDQGGTEDLRLLSQEDFGGGSTGFYGIEDVIAGPEDKDVFTFRSATGKSLTVTEGHPIAFATGDQETKEEFMGPASEVPSGDHVYLINQDGSYDRIISIATHPYQGMTVNFTAMSPSRMVYTNGFKTGDNSWQQYLLMNDARVLTVGDIQTALANQQ